MCIACLSFTVVKQKKIGRQDHYCQLCFLVFKSQVVPWRVSGLSCISISFSPVAIKAELEKNLLGTPKVSNIKLSFYLLSVGKAESGCDSLKQPRRGTLFSFGHEQGTGSWGQCVTQLSYALGQLEIASCLLSPFPTHFLFSFSAFM